MWNAQSIQAVEFVSEIKGIRAEEVFERLWDTEPEGITRNKVPRPDNPFLSTAVGQVGEFMSEVQVQPGRVDVHVLARHSPETGFEGIEAAPVIKDLTDRLGKRILFDGPIVRAALVSTLAESTKNLDESNAKIFDLLGFDPGLSGTDVNFQMNVRKNFNFDSSMSMNRLLRYQAILMQRISIGSGQGAVQMGVPTAHAVSLAIDLNTVPDGRFIESKDLATIFGELRDEALRIGASGELKALRER